MKNFKRILAIVLVVMMVVPMMATGLSAATAESLNGQFPNGVTFAGGNWKAYSYNDWSDHMGESLAAFDDLATYNVDAEGQITLYNHIQQAFNSHAIGWVNLNPINVLQSTNTTAIDGLYFRNGMPSQAGNAAGMFTEEVSYAFSENQLLGSLSPDVFTKENGFAVEGGMVTDGLVINMVNTDNDITSNGAVFNTITAYVMDGGKIVSEQSFETAIQGDQTFGLCVAHAHNTFISFTDGVVTFHVEDNYSANGAYFNQTYTFDQLDTSTLSTYKDYYFCVGSKGVGEKNADGTVANFDGSVNLNLARISTFTIDAATGLYTAANADNKNIADWTGHGVASCLHETWSDWTETLAPSCTTTGIEERTCQGCGKVEQQTVAALGHSYGEWTVDTAATCTEAGSQSRICSVCKNVDTAVIAATGHAWGEWTETLAPTCTTDGEKERICGTCEAVESAVVAALGHDWVWDVLPTADVNGQRTCATCATVEADLAYDLAYYWTTASDNKVGNIDAAYADYNDEYVAEVTETGTIQMMDMSYCYGGDYSYYPVLKATSLFKTDLEGFSVTVKPLTTDATTIAYQYPTTLSFLWTNYVDHYDDAAEYSVYNPASVGLSNKLSASRYGHIWGTYLAGEYTFCTVLADTSFIYSQYDYGTPNDAVYDWLYTTVVSNGNYWTTKMDTIAVDATAPITVGLLYEFDPSDVDRENVAYVDINGELYAPGVGADHQLLTQSYYFSVAAYGDGANQHTASFEITDVCGEAPATFAGYTHECYTEHFETAATCTEDGYAYDICLACKTKTNEVITPATGNHNYVVTDVVAPTCTENGYSVYTCELCGDTYNADPVDAEGHPYSAFVTEPTCTEAGYTTYTCDVCGDSYVADEVAATGHAWGEWFVTVKPTYYEVGEETRVCEICATPETREVATKSWLITFDTVGGIMPEGVPTEMGINTNENYKEATGYDYPVPTYEGGGYTFGGWYWDVYNYILDEGTWNGGYFAVSQDVALEALWYECEHVWGDWVVDEATSTQSRTCTACGAVETEEIVKVEAEATATGNVISVTGLDDTVKDVFISAGAWSTYAEMKPNKVFCITPANSRVVDGAFDYTVAENGTYTVMIRYNDGTMEAKVFVLECNEGNVSALTVDGNTVTVTGLNDLLVLRHVAGEYSTSYDIKRAEGVVNVPGYSKRIVEGVYTVTLEPGTYSFVTQFNDGNFVYYTVVIEEPVVAKDYTITFDTVGGTMPEGVPTEIGINYQENYKEAAGFDYPVPTMEGWVFDGWIWNEYNYILTEGDWNGGYYAVQQSIVLEALWVEAPVA